MVKGLKTYLTENKVEHLHVLFKELGIDEPQLLAKLKYSDLEKLGVENLIERRKVFDIINEINHDMNNEETEADKDVFTGSLGIDASSILWKDIRVCNDQAHQGVSRESSKPNETSEEFSTSGIFLGNKSLFDDHGSIGWRLMPRGKENVGKPLFDVGSTNTDEDGQLLGSESIFAGSSGVNERDGKIVVCVRKKPRDGYGTDVVDVDGKDVVVNESKFRIDMRPYTEQHKFAFDHCFDEHKKNIDVYKESVRDIVDYVIGGGFGTVLAYGQTGTGKTYTMLEKDTGVIYLAIKDLLTSKKQGTITFCEIYMGQVHDLLDGGKKIQLREVNDIVHLANSKEVEFRTSKEVFEIIKKGLSLRKTGITGANTKSSRSHVVILISFFDRKISMAQGKLDESRRKSSGSIIFVDLAGSERGSDRKDVNSDVKNEGAEINKSLLALKECIRGIEKDRKHLPFRQSKLTQILKNSFIGASKTCLIATISPTVENIEHTLNTLRYASRIKEGSHQEARGDSSGGFTIRPHPVEERSRKPSLITATPENMRRMGAMAEIRKILSCIEDTLPSLHGVEELERVLGLCKDLKNKMDLKTNGY